MRARRVANEARFLDMLAAANPNGLTVAGWDRQAGGDTARVTLLDTPAYLIGGGVARKHEFRLVLPEYFPSAAIEAWLEIPVAHPNVHPVNGFVCLWARHAPGNTIVEALLQVQRIITWDLWNPDPEHAIQPEAGVLAPLPCTSLELPAEYSAGLVSAPRPRSRSRLSPREP
jgi:hypothetical protein